MIVCHLTLLMIVGTKIAPNTAVFNRVSRQNPVMCIPALSSNSESYGVSEELEKRWTEFRLFLLSKFESFVLCVCWLKLLPRLKVALSGIMGEAKFCQMTLLNICLVPGTEGTGKPVLVFLELPCGKLTVYLT